MTIPLVLTKNLFGNLRQRGIRETCGLYWFRAREKYRDWRLGIRTTGMVDWTEISTDPACHDYEAINYRCLDAALDYIDPDPDVDVFADYGCGKGRALILAAERSFRRVIGVELSPELCEAARENIRRTRAKLNCDIEVVTANATEFALPNDVTVVFMFNPFAKHIMRAALQRIHKSLAANPRRLRIVYMHPIHEADELAEYSWLAKQHELPTGNWTKVRFVVYESVSDVSGQTMLPSLSTGFPAPAHSDSIT